jgi:hypothetical protein
MKTRQARDTTNMGSTSETAIPETNLLSKPPLSPLRSRYLPTARTPQLPNNSSPASTAEIKKRVTKWLDDNKNVKLEIKFEYGPCFTEDEFMQYYEETEPLFQTRKSLIPIHPVHLARIFSPKAWSLDCIVCGEVSFRDCQRLRKSTWLNDALLSGYVKVMNGVAHEAKATIAFVSAGLTAKLNKTIATDVKMTSFDWSVTKSLPTIVSLLQTKTVVFAVNNPHHHFISLKVDVTEEKKIKLVISDSGMNGLDWGTNLIKPLTEWLAHAFPSFDQLIEVNELASPQQGGHDCGVKVCQQMEVALKEALIGGQVSVDALYSDIGYRILIMRRLLNSCEM